MYLVDQLPKWGVQCLGTTLMLWGSWGLSHPSIAIPSFQPNPQPQQTHAIVQLQGLDLPTPKIKGGATLPLKIVNQTQVYSTFGMLGALPGRFLIDTGASTTMISAAMVQDLKLQGKVIPGDRLTSAVAGNECASMNATLHELPPLKLQSVEIRGVNGLRFEKTTIPDGLAGVLGMDILHQLDLQFQPQALTLKISPPTPLPPNATALAIPLQRKLGVFIAKLMINGQGPVSMLLDTAADSTFISVPLAQRLNLDPKARQPIQILGFCGAEPAERSQLTSVKLQQHEQKNIETIILSSPILKLLGVDGILGQNFLSHYQQHWRFTPYSTQNFKADGSLLLTPP